MLELSIRQEGDMWVAYLMGGDDRGPCIGAIHTSCHGREDLRQAFIDLMKRCVSHIFREASGATVVFDEAVPGQHRAGNA